jgi:hypothetical protein
LDIGLNWVWVIKSSWNLYLEKNTTTTTATTSTTTTNITIVFIDYEYAEEKNLDA